ncbi:MAG: aspartyl beta-hydroxylase, partial [Acidobacteriota bacterium]
RNPFTALFRREMPVEAGADVHEPDGFIFHLSRCGSTLISRSLAAVESTLAISEAAPVDEVVRTGRADWLKAMVSALGGVRGAAAERYIVKLDCWHIHSLPLFRAAFPKTPRVFVFREPREVLVSWLRSPGIQALPGAMDPARLGMRPEDITSLTRQQWGCRVLERLMTAALRHRGDPLTLYVDYRELPGAIWTRIAEHFQLRLTARETERVRAAAARDAKDPERDFAGDREEKRRLAEALAPDAGLARLAELYDELASLSRSSSR